MKQNINLKILIFLITFYNVTYSKNLKLQHSDILYKEDLLMKNYIDSIKDSRQKKLLINKFTSYFSSNLRNRKIFPDDFFDLSKYNSDSIKSKNSQDYEDFKYLKYDEIIKKIDQFSKAFPNLIEVSTSQKLYNLPNPIGDCGNKYCENYIVFLGNKNTQGKETPQMYISCALHGDEQVGPTLCVEFIELMLKNYASNQWIKFLMDNRQIILTPMTNAYGYYIGMREEIVDKNGGNISIDPNRDFPILKRRNECMQTISARTINEIYLSHLIRFSLSIHAGTSSLTYGWGTPSHLTQLNEEYKLPIKNLKTNFNNDKAISELIEAYYSSQFDEILNQSTKSPENNALEFISQTLSYNSNKEENFRYKTGSMTDLVYPVRGGYEDWAYSGSWEGYPTVTQQCRPETYNGYSIDKTSYDKLYPDAAKSISLLLETSDSKSPPENNLGKKRKDCLLSILPSPFQEIDKFIEKECLSKLYNGYISKNIRLLLLSVDLLQPYIHVVYSISKIIETKKVFSTQWIVGGSFTVDETFIMYNYITNNDNFSVFENEVHKYKNDGFKIIPKLIKNNINNFKFTKIQHGIGVSNTNSKDNNYIFEEIMDIPYNATQIQFIILAKVDQGLKYVDNPDPNILPQTHYVNERINSDYYATNNEYIIKGKTYFSSPIITKEL